MHPGEDVLYNCDTLDGLINRSTRDRLKAKAATYMLTRNRCDVRREYLPLAAEGWVCNPYGQSEDEDTHRRTLGVSPGLQESFSTASEIVVLNSSVLK